MCGIIHENESTVRISALCVLFLHGDLQVFLQLQVFDAIVDVKLIWRKLVNYASCFNKYPLVFKFVTNINLEPHCIRSEMDNLPELLLEKILGYLDLRDRLKLRAVSRGWRDCIDNMKTRTLFYSELKRGHINGKNWLVSHKFDINFIGSTQFEPFEPFLNNFVKSFLSNLRHLRIFSFTMKDSSSLSQALNSLSELEELDLLKLTFETIAYFQLNLPSLKSIQLDELSGLGQLTLDGPKLQRIHIGRFSARLNVHPLEIVHVETVEEAVIYDAHILDVKKLKNLKCLYLYCRCCLGIGSRFLQNLPQLEEIHLHRDNFSIEIFTQKQAQKRDKLKIYHCGFLLNDLAEMNQFQTAILTLIRRRNSIVTSRITRG